MSDTTGLAVGLDIGETAVRAAQLKVGSGSSDAVLVTHLAEVPLPEGTIVGGTIKDPKTLSTALKRLWRSGHFAGKRAARFNLPETAVLSRRTSAPWMVPEDFRKALRFQVGNALPIELDSVELDYFLLGEREEVQPSGRTTRMNDILLVAGPREEVVARSDSLIAARINPLAADTTAFPLIRAATVGLRQRDGRVHALVDVGSNQLTLVLHRDGVPEFIRAIPGAAGSGAVKAVTDALDLADAPGQALERVITSGLSGAAPVVVGIAESSVFATSSPSATNQERDLATQALDSWAAVLVREIRESLEYYQGSSTDAVIADVTIAGRTSTIPGLAERFATTLPYRILRFDPLAGFLPSGRVAKDPPVDARFATAIGLALGREA